MKYKRIYIFGLTASGKTTLAKILSKKLNIKTYSLDDIVFKKKWNERYSQKIQRKKLREIYTKTKWIIEGVHTKDWIKPVVSRADKVIFLNIPKLTLIKRALKRAKEKRKDNKTYEKIKLIYWILKFGPKDYRAHKKDSKKFIEIKSTQDIKKLVKTLK